MGKLTQFTVKIAKLIDIVASASSILACIWLITLDKWYIVIYGILSSFISASVLGYALMPQFLFATLALALREREVKYGSIGIRFIGMLYVYAIFTAWCLAVFYFSVYKSDVESFIPIMLWSYFVALAPIKYMSFMEKRSGSGHAGTEITKIFIQTAYAIALVEAIFIRVSTVYFVMTFVFAMTAANILKLNISRNLKNENNHS